jgi:hypothetical protein
MYEVMYTAWRKSALAQRRTEVGSRTVAAVRLQFVARVRESQAGDCGGCPLCVACSRD